MTAARSFWLDALSDCDISHGIPLPFDRHRVSDEHRTGRGTSITVPIDDDLSQKMLAYASGVNVKLEHLLMASFYTFLFKLTNGERDLCIGMNTHGRYKSELLPVVGMFVNAIPLRCRLDPDWSFARLVEYVNRRAEKSLGFSYFPLQHILAQHPLTSRPAFLDTAFEFHSASLESADTRVRLGDVCMLPVPHSIKIGTNEIVSKFDFSLTIEHESTRGALSCIIDASLDLFDASTIEKIAQRFLFLLKQLFDSDCDRVKQPIYQYSLVLPEEALLMQSINDTQVPFSPSLCTHQEFAYQANDQSQKVAVELDEQSLTYGELLYHCQRLAHHLLVEQQVMPHEIICQCVERSISMVS
jgi:non-ribosomal peptide synthetase component F